MLKYLEVDCQPRYWEDTILNGVEDEEGNIPLRQGDSWRFFVELETGKIVDWPIGTTAKTHYKVCDAGNYYLTDENRERLFAREDNYVPGDFLAFNRTGYGDYVILDINEEGVIENWDPALGDYLINATDMDEVVEWLEESFTKTKKHLIQ